MEDGGCPDAVGHLGSSHIGPIITQPVLVMAHEAGLRVDLQDDPTVGWDFIFRRWAWVQVVIWVMATTESLVTCLCRFVPVIDVGSNWVGTR